MGISKKQRQANQGRKWLLSKLDELISNLETLISKTEGTRKYSYKIRLAHAEAMRKRVKRGARQKKATHKGGIYHGEGYTTFVRGGTTGLKR